MSTHSKAKPAPAGDAMNTESVRVKIGAAGLACSKPGLRKVTDKLAAALITVSGVAVILAMIAMLVLIVREAAPLFMSAAAARAGTAELPAGVKAGDVAAMGVAADLSGKYDVAGVVLRDGRVGFSVMDKGVAGPFAFSRPEGRENARVLSAQPHGGGQFSVLWDDYKLTLLVMDVAYPDAKAEGAAPSGRFRPLLETSLDPARGAPLYAVLRGDETAYNQVAAYWSGAVETKTLRPAKGLLNRGKGKVAERVIDLGNAGPISSAAADAEGAHLYLGTAGGELLSLDLSGDPGEKIVPAVTPAFPDRHSITSLEFLAGDYALAVGDSGGGVSVWFPRREGGEFRLRESVEWRARGGAVVDILPGTRDRSILALSEDGGIRWLYSTTGEKLLDIDSRHPMAVKAALNERSDRLLALRLDGRLDFYRLDSSYPEAGWAGFFKRLLYEGYEKPAFVWQSTGSDTSEPKLSLVPLIWGSLKAALYALVFATPLALAAAMYLSQFANPVWRARLKPAVEMLAAVPSVVIGFLAALWLAPMLEQYVKPFIGDMHYDQRNSLVIAIAMGFAVIPTIFSLAEDAITAVPPSLSAASLALGASKWQTVCRVVLPSASPGIFTAVMLGLGRAVGETMIVLMAAGNTPILSLSPFDGMRTLSANIAVEMPEAPVGGTLFRTLFLCALILFVLTLAINTAAEVFRQRLRRRYGRL